MKHSLQLHAHGEKAFRFPDTLFFQVTYKKWYSVNVPRVSKSGLLIKIVALRNKRIVKLLYKDIDINQKIKK